MTVLKATLNLIHSPPSRILAVVGFDDIFKAADAIPDVLDFKPIAVEGMAGLFLRYQ